MPRMSVRNFLALALVALGVLPLALFALVFFSVLETHLGRHADELSRALLRSVAATAGERAIEGPRRDLPSILLLAESAPGREAIRTMLRDVKSPRPEYLAVAILAPDGRVEAAFPDDALRPGLAYSVVAASGPVGSTVYSPPFYSAAFGGYVVEASYFDGKRRALALLDLEWLSARLYLMSGSKSDRLGVVWADGRYVASSDPSRMRVGERVPTHLLTDAAVRYRENGSSYLVTSERIPGSEWRALYYRSWPEIRRPLVELSLRIGLLAALTLGVSAFIALLSWRWITSPLELIAHRVAQLRDGEEGERVAIDSPAELRAIAETLDDMAEAIASRGQALERGERRYRALFEHAGIPALLVAERDGAIVDANGAAASFYGRPIEALRGLKAYELAAEPCDAVDSIGRPYAEARHRLASGELRDVTILSSDMDLDGQAATLSFVIDVTERRQAEARTKAALEEKTLLLREVYHRVKNNLQVVSSLLSMQAALAEGSSATALQGAQDRVFTMSLAHELAYQMPDVSSIDAGDYASRLIAYLADKYFVSRERIHAEYGHAALDLERAVPFGLLLCEVASNALKYGLGAEGGIRLTLATGLAGKEIAITVEDDGPGLPPDIVSKGSLGISLIVGLAEQLQGAASWERPEAGGTRVVVRFPSVPRKDAP